jgi:hypothetical protein
MFRHRQQLRRWSAGVLLLWLFGLGAGFANACLTSSPADTASPPGHHGAVAPVPHHDSSVDEESHHDHLAMAGHDGLTDHHGTIAKTNCQDFCGKAAVSIPPLKATLDDAQAHALVATFFTTTALPVPAYEPLQLWVPRRDGVQAPPIPIAFLRLAL